MKVFSGNGPPPARSAGASVAFSTWRLNRSRRWQSKGWRMTLNPIISLNPIGVREVRERRNRPQNSPVFNCALTRKCKLESE